MGDVSDLFSGKIDVKVVPSDIQKAMVLAIEKKELHLNAEELQQLTILDYYLLKQNDRHLNTAYNGFFKVLKYLVNKCLSGYDEPIQFVSHSSAQALRQIQKTQATPTSVKKTQKAAPTTREVVYGNDFDDAAAAERNQCGVAVN